MPSMLNRHKDFTGTNHRWLEGEASILRGSLGPGDGHFTDRLHAVRYAREYIKGRWPGLEKAWENFESPRVYLNAYMQDALPDNERWSFGEKLLLESDNQYSVDHLLRYGHRHVKGRWPELEDVLIRGSAHYEKMAYVRDILKGPWSYLEDELLEMEHIINILDYLKYSKRPYWPEAENIFISEDYHRDRELYAREYLKLFPERRDAIEELLEERYPEEY